MNINAIIAGTGSLPIDACTYFLKKNEPFFVISLFPEDNGAILRSVVGNKAHIITEKCYKLGAILDHLKKNKTTHALMIGKVDKQHLLKRLKFDWLSLKIMAQTLYRGDKNVMDALLVELEKNNIEVLPQSTILQSLFVPAGILIGAVSETIQRDINVGMNVANQISMCDIGQTVVVKDGMVLAVEAIEGTDACIKRGLELGKNDIVICKAARIDQNKKYDLPTLGPTTIAAYKKGDIAAIAWQSSQTFIADKNVFIEHAQRQNMTLVSI